MVVHRVQTNFDVSRMSLFRCPLADSFPPLAVFEMGNILGFQASLSWIRDVPRIETRARNTKLPGDFSELDLAAFEGLALQRE